MNKICPICHKAFHVKPSHIEKRTYCSKECMVQAYRDRFKGENNPHWKGGDVQKACIECGKMYNVIPALESISKYCSRKCQNSAIARLPRKARRPETKPRKKKATRPAKQYYCVVCGKVVARKRKYCSMECRRSITMITLRCPVCFKEYKTYKAHPNKHCSSECYHKEQAWRQRGSKSHFWQGGKTLRTMQIRGSGLYTEWREKVMKRDNYTCQSCLRSSKDFPMGALTAHHVRAFSTDVKHRLKVSNGITLCWQCHRDFHRMTRNGLLETSESKLRDAVDKYFKTEPGVWMFKVHGGPLQMTGLPDFIGVVAGRFCGVELKVYPNFPTPMQITRLRQIQDAGGAGFVCRSLEEVIRVVNLIKESIIGGE